MASVAVVAVILSHKSWFSYTNCIYSPGYGWRHQNSSQLLLVEI